MQDFIECRKERRAAAVFLPARIDTNGVSYLAMMRDHSPDGAGLQCPANFAPGELVSVGIGDEELRQARVVWQSGERVGVQFDPHPRIAPRPHSRGYRSVRIPVNLAGEIYVDGVRHCSRIVNLSPRGIAVETDLLLATGTPFSMIVAGEEFTNVTVRWCCNGLIGAQLAPSVPLRRLQLLVAFGDGAAPCARVA